MIDALCCARTQMLGTNNVISWGKGLFGPNPSNGWSLSTTLHKPVDGGY